VVERMTKGGREGRVSEGLLANGMSHEPEDGAVRRWHIHNAVALSLKANKNAAKENRSKQQ